MLVRKLQSCWFFIVATGDHFVPGSWPDCARF